MVCSVAEMLGSNAMLAVLGRNLHALASADCEAATGLVGPGMGIDEWSPLLSTSVGAFTSTS